MTLSQELNLKERFYLKENQIYSKPDKQAREYIKVSEACFEFCYELHLFFLSHILNLRSLMNGHILNTFGKLKPFVRVVFLKHFFS